ncbi:hypothetical protein [Tsuneonella sp. HG222]
MAAPAYLHDGSWEPTPEQRELVERAFEAFGFFHAVKASKGRRKEVSCARHAACWVLRARYGDAVTLPMIAAMVGRRDHSTAHNSLLRADLLRKQNPHFRAVTDALLAGLPVSPAAQRRVRFLMPPRRVRARNDFGQEDHDGARRAACSDLFLTALRKAHPERFAA